MKPLLKTSLIIGLASLGVVTAAYALQSGHSFTPAMLDADRDGVVSAAEVDTHADQLFARVDQDRNGQLSPDEATALHAMMQGVMRGQPAQHGAGHTGLMSQAQFRAALRGHATAMDTDRDGRLTVAELNTAFQHRPAH